jgi:Domain of unknown function (DUF222)
VARLDAVLAELAGAVADCGEVSDADRIDRIARLERLRAVTAALQAAECVRFARSQTARQMAADTHPAQIGRGIADQIALACRISPVAGSRRLGTARALWHDLPDTLAQLTTGSLSERVAETIVTETRHLDAPTRRRVDQQLAAAGIGDLGHAAAAALTRKTAYQADPHGYLHRGRTERRHRRVGLRPAPDTMALLTGYLPVEQGVACYAALRRAADTATAAGDPRTRDQIMADTLVERVTGQTRATDPPIELHLTLPLAALTHPDQTHTATLHGAGPLPADLARHILTTSRGRKWWRRLFTTPTGHLAGGDPTRRRFDGWLGRLLTLRDHTCRDPYCDAPIRHLDHITRHADGGPTTLPNGRGTCARGNYTRELPGWHVTLLHDGTTHHPHTIEVTTPTGHRYQSRAPDPT